MRQELAERRLQGAGNRSVTVNLAESSLSWLASRGRISDRQLVAGETLRADWERAALAPSTTMRWDTAPRAPRGAGMSRAPDPSTSQLDAKRRFDAAVAHVGTGLSDILWRVVCANEGLAEAERALGWPARSGKLVLGLALDRLADFYRIR
ncbi:hypothetical protein GON01_09180 [Sphingomonas sp. MAH-20]|uniref:DUF6456 domain-containing protein n=1 Tax=Sphingomonas horti TaxID=2682842 RepID=A0A6I4J1E6_9SPHN|nr:MULTISPECIES: DUF6456 domain-containing protein [Sphingomonas]MBA2919867.1 hypothetical protein [Sphingomonas sp. CGMCC 1.13658]MVO78106.1 hypothetical protein [Sphingomonas horti]